MNKVILIGNLARDPELSQTSNGTPVCRFSLAVNRQYENAEGKRECDFFNITTWRGLAENVSKFTQKGKKVAVFGEIQLRNYEDKDGIKRQSVDIVASEVEFLSPKSDEGASGGSGYRQPRLLEDDDDSCPFK